MTVLQDALAGIGKTVFASSATVPSPAHAAFIESQLLVVVHKLQKEVGWRKYKECHAPLQEAVLALKLFQTEEWPRRPSAASQQQSLQPLQSQSQQSQPAAPVAHVVAVAADEEATAVTVDTQETDDDENDEHDVGSNNNNNNNNSDAGTTTAATDAVTPAAATPNSHTTTASGTVAASSFKDDPQTREPVHSAIVTTLHALMQVLDHPSKQPRPTELALEGVQLIVANRYLSGRAGGGQHSNNNTINTSSHHGGNAAAASPTAPKSPSSTSLLHRVLESVSAISESNVEAVQTQLIHTLTTIVTSPKCSVHEASMLLALRSTFHVYLVTKQASLKRAAKKALLDMLRAVFFRMEAHDAVQRTSHSAAASVVSVSSTAAAAEGEPSSKEASVGAKTNNINNSTDTSFASQYHADAYYFFRALCKLSSKELPADTMDESGHKNRLFNSLIPTDPTELTSKLLSLELLLSAVELCGRAFLHRKFLYLVQHYLCGSLLKNCVSNHVHVAFLSQKIFLVLVYKFKGHLKQDIEVFMSNVFFRVLESQNSSFKQKALVLESLRSLCKDPVLLTQIFLNYDCDFDAMNLYKDIVHMLTKLGGKATQAPSLSKRAIDTEQEFELSLAAIECLVTILSAFLRALGLHNADDNEHDNDSAGARIRGMLQLDSALAVATDDTTATNDMESVVSDDASGVLVHASGSPNHNNSTNDGASVMDKGSGVADKIVDAFDRKRTAEQNFEMGAVKFTLSLKSGLNFFIDNGFLQRDAQEVAQFFIAHKDKLDKTQMGEALGREPDAPLVKDKSLDADKGGPGFWVRILHFYAESLDLEGLEFDEAIRLFLSGFRLPGEAQKIDRIMEKFAERFTTLNPDVFPSSDTAFILAFSVIMLNTDLHNPSIKPERRMTVDSFLRNNRGIGDNGSDLPEEFLRGIFERIKERPFSLKEDDAARERAGVSKQIFDTSAFFEGPSTLFGSSADERKRENFKKERDEMMAVTEQLIRRRPGKNSDDAPVAEVSESAMTEAIAPADVVKPMFDVTWGPLLGILSQILECADDERSVAVCLNGFVYAIRLAAHGRMSLSRDTFVSSLAKFTFLGSLKEMKRKNVESIRTLLSVAVIDGEFLGESWGPVLRCMSQLARLRLTASGLESDESFLMVESPNRKSETKNSNKVRHSAGDVGREAEESNGKAVLEAVQEVLIDKVFSSTVNLSAKSLAHFVEQLIVVASSEIAGTAKSSNIDASPKASDSSPKASAASKVNVACIFSLQRLVDVADYNMDVRPRLVWAQVWELMADFFVNLACHENRMVSFFAIDSLKQLSLKFLQKGELSEFNFQCSFLQPFLVVMEDKNSRFEIRELVLQCVDNIIRTKSHNLRSGWKVVFSILNISAGDPSEKIEYMGLAILQNLLDEHLDDIGSLVEKHAAEGPTESMSAIDQRNRNANADDFVVLCRASLAFVQLEESDSLRPFGLTLRAFCHTACYADLLAANKVLPPVSGAQSTDPKSQGYTYSGLSESESLSMVLWRPIFEGLAEGVRSTAKTSASGVGCLVQRASILALRAILLRHGHLFSTPQLSAILRDTVLPAIQSAAEADQSPVVGITSETPSMSNIDFLVEPLPLPPDPDDPLLLLFSEKNTTSKRVVGAAEVMLEASFTDLRHCGNGDLRKAHLLANKSSDEAEPSEQPFPDSWLATTAPIALGLLTDITSEFVVYRENDGRNLIWPVLASQYKAWCIGRYSNESIVWSPCEALVRISCRELYRLPRRMFSDGEFKELSKSEQMVWASKIVTMSSEILAKGIVLEDESRIALLALKEQATIDRRNQDSDDADLDAEPLDIANNLGTGGEASEKKDEPGLKVNVGVDNLNSKVTPSKLDADSSLNPDEQAPEKRGLGIPAEVAVPDAYWVHTVPTLKIRCVTAHCLQQSLLGLLDDLVPLANQQEISDLLLSLNRSRKISREAAKDDDISTAFQESLLKDWGDGIQLPDEATETTARLSLLHGSAIFFLSQEAGATKSVISLLSTLYLDDTASEDEETWDKVSFAEPHLVETMVDVLDAFNASEEKDGHLIDPNVWRTASENGGKVALYCTTFASVVLSILKIITSMRCDQFRKHKEVLIGPLFALVKVHSQEIRQVVHEVLVKHVSSYLSSSA